MGILGGAKPVNHVSALTPPSMLDPSIAGSAAATAAAAARTAGRASTIATSGLGDTSQALVTKKTLLGVG